MKRVLLLTLCALPCGPFALANAGDAAPAAVAAPAAKPQTGTWGIDLTAMDRSVRPGDDFYSFVNGGWNARTTIPDDKLEVGGLAELQDKALAQTRAILEEAAADANAPAGSERRKIGDWYASFMDEAAIEKAGFAPIAPELTAIDAVKTRGQLLDLFARNHGAVGAKPLVVGVDFDRNRIKRTIVSIDIAPLSLGARELYLEPPYAPVRDAQRAHIARLLKAAGFDDVEARAKRVQDLETKIAAITWTAADLRDDLKKNNVMTVAELQRRAPGIDWAAYIAKTGVGAPPELIMSTPSSITAMTKLVATEPLEAWQDYMRYMTVLGLSKYLPKAARDEVFEFYGRQLAGQQAPGPRWIDGLLDLGNQGRPLADPLSKLYVARHVPPVARPTIDAMIDNLMAAFDERLAKSPWMSPETRAAARDKLSKVTLKALYPEVWRDVSALQVVRGDPVGNARRAAAWSRAQDLEWLREYPDRRIFLQPVYLVNAYANPAWNEIVFLAAIVQPPAFDPAADPAVNYGAMGAVIGHEISHLFDDKGRASDGEGRLRDWWAPKDAARFEAIARQLEQQVGAYEPIPGQKVNGALTLGESIADLAGLVVAYDAWKRSLGGREPPVLDGFTGDQRFFMSYAQAWRWKGRPESVAQMMKTDPHPPSAVRPNTVRNVDAWYAAFDVKPGDKLYLKPEERVRFW